MCPTVCICSWVNGLYCLGMSMTLQYLCICKNRTFDTVCIHNPCVKCSDMATLTDVSLILDMSSVYSDTSTVSTNSLKRNRC
jgi:hypothetical protein